MSTFEQSQHRAGAVLALGLFAAFAFILVMAVGAIAVAIGKGGAAVYQTVAATLEAAPPGGLR